MRTHLSLAASFVLLAAVAARASDKPRPAPPVKPAGEYTLHEEHATENVTVAAEPCVEPDQCKFFRNPYVQHGFLPVRVIVTNDRDQPVLLDDVRIQFIPADGAKEAAATDEDLNRRLFHARDASVQHVPILGIPYHKEQVDTKITNDDADFGFASTTVPPHSTRAGYVFYDTQGVDDPPIHDAELFLKEIYTTDAKGSRVQLFSFTLPFNTWLKAQPKPDTAKKPAEGK